MTSLRLIPTLVIAASALFLLKLIGFALNDGQDAPSPVSVAVAQSASAAGGSAGEGAGTSSETTATGAGAPGAGGPQADGAAATAATPGETALPPGGGLPAGSLELGGSIAERKVLESLSGRRRELDKREKQFDLRQEILKASEARLQKKVEDLKALEASIKSLQEEREEKRNEELRDLVIMYESMKAKDAARIFNRLDLDILLQVAKQMKPRKMADVMARMSPEASERLTVALVKGGEAAMATVETVPAELPKIRGN
ncbi:hypothetical protein H1W37_02245 [Stappia taiwanensis]|uniref:Flagellar motility protein MotE, a chaperone for MotC folding n=1 Tax=Stappia taiwanensis TaxID=992267 RepID=A0A838XUC4_9HYPH|nr:hypothetical protein [Stappia taiwanensis]MBA4610460.1 hypothetical protein [Stappia taiwanensis]GGE84773.1 hypothetical protein GCM10007285_10450 [Stappia taiwanensis]